MSSRSLVGWRRTLAAGGVLLTPPDGSAVRVRIHLRRAPLVPVPELAAAAARGMSRVLRSEAVRLVTQEGEYGALINVSGEAHGAPVQRTLGVVTAEDWYALIDGACEDPDRFDLLVFAVEKLTRFHSLGLGTDRWRRYLYTPPDGWQPVPRPRAVSYLSPGYPKNGQMITVFDARPAHLSATGVQHRRLFEDLSAEWGELPPSEALPIQTRGGLSGEMMVFRARGPDQRILTTSHAALVGNRYLYLIRLETPQEGHEEALPSFHALIDSVEALPVPSTGAGELIHWSE